MSPYRSVNTDYGMHRIIDNSARTRLGD